MELDLIFNFSPTPKVHLPKVTRLYVCNGAGFTDIVPKCCVPDGVASNGEGDVSRSTQLEWCHHSAPNAQLAVNWPWRVQRGKERVGRAAAAAAVLLDLVCWTPLAACHLPLLLGKSERKQGDTRNQKSLGRIENGPAPTVSQQGAV